MPGEIDRMSSDIAPDWDLIVECHAPRVFRVALRILGSVADAEDVSQDVFTEAYRMHKSGPIQTWTGLLVRLATLRSLDRLRRTQSTVEIRDSDKISTLQPFEEVVAAELAAWLRVAIRRLPDQQSNVFVMFHFEQMNRESIATSLGISPEAVSTALHKARQRLTTELAIFNRGASK
jgi:RNA polymerase sigma-70 factor, ECF subfamily